jgi:hypothetical protein
MRKILLVYFVIGITFLNSCSKSSTDIVAHSKVDVLFTQLKAEPQFLEYLNAVNSTMEVLNSNLSKTTNKDTSIIRNKSLTFEQKNKLLNINSPQELNDKLAYSNSILTKLLNKYPTMKDLTNDESKELYKKAYKYYFKTKLTKS